MMKQAHASALEEKTSMIMEIGTTSQLSHCSSKDLAPSAVSRPLIVTGTGESNLSICCHCF